MNSVQMFGTESQIDADFYRLIHQLTGGQRNKAGQERRGRPRRPFLASQRIAPQHGSEFPEAAAFVRVHCHDLTRGGFSFLISTRPDFTRLVAEFTCPPEVIYVGAEVLHCADVLVHRSGLVEQVEGRARHVSSQAADGRYARPMFLVGCRFTKKLQKPATEASMNDE